jgi:hypothetical protein
MTTSRLRSRGSRHSRRPASGGAECGGSSPHPVTGSFPTMREPGSGDAGARSDRRARGHQPTAAGRGKPPASLDWPDSGDIAIITWHTSSGEMHQQELASRPEAEELLAKIRSNNESSLVSAQVRRVGIGPDS